MTKFSRRAQGAGLVVLFLVHALPFLSRPALIGGDEPHYALMASSMAIDGDLQLEDDYHRISQGSKAAGKKFAGKELDPHLRPLGEELMFAHPLGLPLVVSPVVALQQWIDPGSAPDLVLILMTLVVTFAAMLAGWDLLCRWLGDHRQGMVLTAALYFATPLWFYGRTFFTEPFLWALPVLAAWAGSRDRWWLASFLLGSTFFLKESAVLVIVPALIWLAWWRGVGRGIQMAVFPALFLVFFLAKNYWLYGQLLVPFQEFVLGDPWQGFLGILFDPRHGLLVFAPLSVLALLYAPRQRGERGLDLFARGVVVLHLGVIAAWVDWGGGSCFGPRLLLPAFPALGVLIVLAWRRWWHRTWFRALFTILTAAGFAIQLGAALDPFLAFWSVHVWDLWWEHSVTSLLSAGFAGVGLWKSLPARCEDAPSHP